MNNTTPTMSRKRKAPERDQAEAKADYERLIPALNSAFYAGGGKDHASPCSNCGKSLKGGLGRRYQHLKGCVGYKPYPCTWHGCTHRTSQKSHLPSHMITHTRERKFPCAWPDCGHKSATSVEMTTHWSTHTGQKPYACPVSGCTHRTRQKSAMNTHQRTHDGKKPYPCKFCDHASSTSGSRDTHERTHTKERPFPCVYDGCTYKAARSNSLINHVRSIHTKERPFACPRENCVYRAAQRGTLDQHIRRHDGIKLFACGWPDCDHRAVTSGDIIVHRRVHTNERPYVCNWSGCDKKYKKIDHLAVHIRGHNGIKPFVCPWPECGHAATSSSPISSHQERCRYNPAAMPSDPLQVGPFLNGERFADIDWPEGTEERLAKDLEVAMELLISEFTIYPFDGLEDGAYIDKTYIERFPRTPRLSARTGLNALDLGKWGIPQKPTVLYETASEIDALYIESRLQLYMLNNFRENTANCYYNNVGRRSPVRLPADLYIVSMQRGRFKFGSRRSMS